MAAPAAQESDGQENWHSRLADRFRGFGTGAERLLPAKLKVSFRLSAGFHADLVYFRFGSVPDLEIHIPIINICWRGCLRVPESKLWAR